MQELVKTLSEKLRDCGLTLATAESCTGGLIAKMVTDQAGSSAVFDCGFVTYSNEAKRRLLNVSEKTLRVHGAVSAQTAAEMVAGALGSSQAGLAVSVTGIAGPGGGSDEKPVGTVFIGFGRKGDIRTTKHYFKGDRGTIRNQAAKAALGHLVAFIDESC